MNKIDKLDKILRVVVIVITLITLLTFSIMAIVNKEATAGFFMIILVLVIGIDLMLWEQWEGRAK